MFDAKQAALLILSSGKPEAEHEEDGSAGPDALKAFVEAMKAEDWVAAYDAFRVAVQSCGYEDDD